MLMWGGFIRPTRTTVASILGILEAGIGMPTQTTIRSTATIPGGCAMLLLVAFTESSTSDTGEGQFASSIGGAMLAYPYAGSDVPTGVLAVANTTFNQGVEAATVAAAIEAAAADSSGPINIFAFSGGAAATTQAFNMLPASDISRIASVTYVSPGTAGVLGTVNGITPTVIYGASGDPADVAATAVGAGLMPSGWNIITTNAPHNFGQEIAAATAQGWSAPVGNACSQSITFSAQHLQTYQTLMNMMPRGFYIPGVGIWDPFDLILLSNPLSAVSSAVSYQLVTSTISYVP
jgi:hypothetical protein